MIKINFCPNKNHIRKKKRNHIQMIMIKTKAIKIIRFFLLEMIAWLIPAAILFKFEKKNETFENITILKFL